MVDLSSVSCVDHRASAEEEQGLEDRVVPDVKEAAAQAEDDPVRSAQRSSHQSQAKAHDDDADVLDAVIGQQPLQVVLADRKGHSEDAGNDAEAPGRFRPIPAAG